MIEKSTRQLVDGFQSGSREAFAGLVQQYQNLVTSIAFARTGDLQRSEDIAQQTFLIAWQKKGELQSPDRFGGWVRGIANKLALNERRLSFNVQRRNQVAIDNSTEPAADLDAPDVGASRLEQSQLLWATLERMPENCREPMILYYREEKSVAAVAGQLGLSEDAVKQRLKRGREMMRQEIELMVENLLFETRPSPAFSATVMAALPSTATLGSSIAKTGAAAGAKFIGAKVAGLLTVGGLIGILGGALGSLIGIGGAWWGTRTAASQATSEEERVLLWKAFRRASIAGAVFSLGVLGLILLTDGTVRWIGLGAAVVVYVIGLLTAILSFNKAQQRLHALHGKPTWTGEPHGTTVVAVRAFRFNAIGMLIGIWCWLLVLATIKSAFVVITLALVAVIVHGSWIWFSASSARTAGGQLRFNGRLCFWASVMQAAVATVGWMTHQEFAAGHGGFPIWALGTLALAAGTVFGLMLTLKGNQLDNRTSAATEKNGL